MGFVKITFKTSCIVSHVHYNNVHAFRCVFTLLLCCLLVGLDWAEPMMNLFLHVTCSCILMHTFLQFYIYIDISVAWYLF